VLDTLPATGDWEVDGVVVRLTNLDKVLFPSDGRRGPFAKRDLVRYYATVAPALLPYLAGRRVNLQRFPDGVERPGFWQQQVPAGAPAWLPVEQARGSSEVHLVVDRAATLVWLANLATVELHPWTASVATPDAPDWALVDIDPGTRTSFEEVLVLARLFRAALDHLGLRACPKTTGGTGLQIWIPVEPGLGFRRTRGFVETLSRSVGSTVPELVSWAWRTEERGGRARLDYTQNGHRRTLVAPWSVRPSAGAPVSVPIEWSELDDPTLSPDRWCLEDAPDRLRRFGDPLADLLGVPQELPEW
jgi:bifunctional non-homologous end joining protein LigD